LTYSVGPWGWFAYPYWVSWRCRWFPWLPRWWWMRIYGPIIPYWVPPMSKEDEIAMLQEEARILEQELDAIRKRLEELGKQ